MKKLLLEVRIQPDAAFSAYSFQVFECICIFGTLPAASMAVISAIQPLATW